MPLRFRRQVAGDAQNNCQLSSRSVDSIVTSNSAFADPDWDLYESVRDGACSASSVAGSGSSSVGGGRGQGGSKLTLLDIYRVMLMVWQLGWVEIGLGYYTTC